eukprot:g8326.t1
MTTVLTAVMVTLSFAETPTGLKGMATEIINRNPGFMVRVQVDRKDRTYTVGETATVTVRSEKNGYLYLIYFQADKQAALLFPNKAQRDNRIVANKPLQIPGTNTGFRLRVQPPFGEEIMMAVVTSRPLKAVELERLDLVQRYLPVTAKGLRGMRAELTGKADRKQRLSWAQHHIAIHVVKSRNRSETNRVRRIGVVITVDQYVDRRIPPLKSCAADAREMTELLKTVCRCDRVFVLKGRHATKRAIEQLLRKQLPAMTRPDDEIIIYWSGHGTRMSDDNGDEKIDHMDEMLVPYDADLSNVATSRRSTISDDEFGRWIQAIDGRRCLLILDCCFAAGQAADVRQHGRTRGLSEGKRRAAAAVFDFLDDELKRTKDIGQKNVALLASSAANQLSWVSRNGKLSIMTECVAKKLKSSRASLTPDPDSKGDTTKLPVHNSEPVESTQLTYKVVGQTPVTSPGDVPKPVVPTGRNEPATSSVSRTKDDGTWTDIAGATGNVGMVVTDSISMLLGMFGWFLVFLIGIVATYVFLNLGVFALVMEVQAGRRTTESALSGASSMAKSTLFAIAGCILLIVLRILSSYYRHWFDICRSSAHGYRVSRVDDEYRGLFYAILVCIVTTVCAVLPGALLLAGLIHYYDTDSLNELLENRQTLSTPAMILMSAGASLAFLWAVLYPPMGWLVATVEESLNPFIAAKWIVKCFFGYLLMHCVHALGQLILGVCFVVVVALTIGGASLIFNAVWPDVGSRLQEMSKRLEESGTAQRLQTKRELQRLKENPIPNGAVLFSIATFALLALEAGGPAVVFEHVRGSVFPAVTNLLGSERRICLALRAESLNEAAGRIARLLRPELPDSFLGSLKLLPQIAQLTKLPPKVVKTGFSQQVVKVGRDVDLRELPIPQSRPLEAGRGITAGQIFTMNPETGVRDVGVAQLSVTGQNTLALHWTPHDDGWRNFRAYQREGRQMPVAIAIGGDPLLTLTASAPLPHDTDECLLAGFLRGSNVELVKARSVPLEVPTNADFIIEGQIDAEAELQMHGPIALPSGFYSEVEPAPLVNVTAMTHRSNPVFPAIVHGVPASEPTQMRAALERLLLPVVQTLVPEIIDFHFPASGASQNVLFVRIRKQYPQQARKVMAALWGMHGFATAKLLVVVDDDVDVRDEGRVWFHVAANVHPGRDTVPFEGPTHFADHAAPTRGIGCKLGLDATRKSPEEGHARQWPEEARMTRQIRDLVDRRWKDYGFK